VIKVIGLSAIIATVIPVAAAQQAPVTDAELRSGYCFAVLAHRVADLQQAQRLMEDRMGRPPNADALARHNQTLSEFRRVLDHQVNNYDRFQAHLLASKTLQNGGAFSQATARGEADYDQCQDELSHHNCTPPAFENHLGMGKGDPLCTWN
jgi:hypothetical protein